MSRLDLEMEAEAERDPYISGETWVLVLGFFNGDEQRARLWYKQPNPLLNCVAPEVIEQVLLGHPDVRDAAVVGIAGHGGLQEVHAAVVLRTPLEEAAFLRWCGEKLRKTPVQTVRFVDAVARNEAGKIIRPAIRELFEGR